MGLYPAFYADPTLSRVRFFVDVLQVDGRSTKSTATARFRSNVSLVAKGELIEEYRIRRLCGIPVHLIVNRYPIPPRAAPGL